MPNPELSDWIRDFRKMSLRGSPATSLSPPGRLRISRQKKLYLEIIFPAKLAIKGFCGKVPSTPKLTCLYNQT
jgi:hypothetical protein